MQPGSDKAVMAGARGKRAGRASPEVSLFFAGAIGLLWEEASGSRPPPSSQLRKTHVRHVPGGCSNVLASATGGRQAGSVLSPPICQVEIQQVKFFHSALFVRASPVGLPHFNRCPHSLVRCASLSVHIIVIIWWGAL